MKTVYMILLALSAGSVVAQPVQDPTRPPAQLLEPSSQPPASAASHALQLQSILIGRAPGGRRVAVIDGETVRVGERIGGARIVAIHPAAVQLERGGKRVTLTLPSPDAAPAPAGKPE